MKVKTVDISKSASAAMIVFESLKHAIINGALADGEPLRQEEIAAMFNTSRIPVREAIAKLEQQGLVTTQRYRGAVVASISVDEAEEIFNFRAMVESKVIKAAVPRISHSTLSEARSYLNAFSKAKNPMQWGELNRKFHYSLYQASAMNYHLAVIRTALDRIDRYLRAQLAFSDGMGRANEEHSAILAACEQGQAELAGHLTRKHIFGAKATLLKYLRQNSEAL